MSRFWNEKTRNISPYVAGEQPREGQKVIKLNTNENPYPPSPAIEKFLKTFDPDLLRLYPDTSCTKLRFAFAEFFGVRAEQIFCGNGSDEVLAFAFQAFFESGEDAAPLRVPDISYSFYPVYADLYNIPLRKVPLNTDFTVPLDPFCEEGGGVAIANPNAPTAVSMSLASVEAILQANPDRVVLIDEAYVCFGGESAVGLLEKYPNLLIIGTLSKSHSLAGLRLGYAIASEELIEGISRIRDSFNSYPVDTLAQKVAELAVLDRGWFERNTAKIIATRERVRTELLALGFDVPVSAANFLFVRPGQIGAAELYNKLRNQGILVRYFNKPRISESLRISIGTDDQMDELIRAIRAILNEGKGENG